MSRVRIHNFSISLDGFATGEGQALDTPFGHAGHRLHEWMFATRFGRRELLGESGGTEGVDHAMADRHGPGIGAEIMGAGKFGPPGWQDDPEWRGWWGDNPPFHTPTYVLTHRPRPSLEMEGGTTFHFLDAAPADALEVARDAAAGQDVRIGGGPTMMRRVHRRRSRRPPARRAGADPARPRCSSVGRPGGVGPAVRRGGSLDAQRRHPPHVHPMTRSPSCKGQVRSGHAAPSEPLRSWPQGTRDRPQPPGRCQLLGMTSSDGRGRTHRLRLTFLGTSWARTKGPRWPDQHVRRSDLGLPGGRDRRRSGDLTLFRRALYQLSYPTPSSADRGSGPDGI